MLTVSAYDLTRFAVIMIAIGVLARPPDQDVARAALHAYLYPHHRDGAA